MNSGSVECAQEEKKTPRGGGGDHTGGVRDAMHHSSKRAGKSLRERERERRRHARERGTLLPPHAQGRTYIQEVVLL